MSKLDDSTRVSEAELKRQDFIRLELKARTIMYKTLGDQTYQFVEREPGQFEFNGTYQLRGPMNGGLDVHDV